MDTKIFKNKTPFNEKMLDGRSKVTGHKTELLRRQWGWWVIKGKGKIRSEQIFRLSAWIIVDIILGEVKIFKELRYRSK